MYLILGEKSVRRIVFLAGSVPRLKGADLVIKSSAYLLLVAAERLTTRFATQNRSKPDCDFIDVRSRKRNKASTSKDIWSSEGSGGDARRTSYTLPPPSIRVYLQAFCDAACASIHY